MPRSFDRLVGVVGIFARRRFAPANHPIHIRLDQQNPAKLADAEARLKRRDKRQMNFAKPTCLGKDECVQYIEAFSQFLNPFIEPLDLHHHQIGIAKGMGQNKYALQGR